MAAREAGASEMTFLDHLEALRWHIIRSIIAILVFTLVAFLNKKLLFDGLVLGPASSEFITFKVLCRLSEILRIGDVLCPESFAVTLINIEMAGQFMAHLLASFIIGFSVAFPFVCWEIWRFVKPALYEREIKGTRGIIFFTSLLFTLGVMFGYFILVPFSVYFFASYQVSEQVANQFTLQNYMSFSTMFVLISGFVFELPMAVYFLAKLGIISAQFMRDYRRQAIVILLIFAAIITPADAATMILVFIPIYLLYESSIFIAKRVEVKEQAED